MTRARSLSQLANSSVFTVATNNRVGIGSEIPTTKLDVDGALNVSGNAAFGGVITYEDVTNIDSVGIITARSGISVPDNQKIQLGAGNDLQIYHTGSHSLIDEAGTGNLTIRSSLISFEKYTNEQLARFTADGSCELFHNNVKKFETTTSGATITGDLTLSDKIIHEGDTNTAIRFPAADTITAETGGSERLRIKSDGTLHAIKTGTQITNAEQTVAVFQRSSASGTTSKISIVSGNGAASHINFGDTDDEDIGQIIYDHSNNSMQFLTNTSERLRIDSSGRLLLNGGTDVRIELGTTGTTGTNNRNHLRGDGSSLKFNTCSGGLHIFEQNGTERMRIDSSGNLIIGSTSAATLSQLTIRAASPNLSLYATPDNASIINLGDTDAYNIGRIKYDNTNNSLQFDANNAERMRIDSSGNMGLGTASPVQKLHLNSTSVDVRMVFTVSSSGSTNSDGCQLQYNSNDFYINNNESGMIALLTAGTERMRIDSSGSVGIGELSPSSYAGSGNQLVVSNASSAAGITIRSSATNSGNLFFSDGTSGTQRAEGYMQYNHAGNYLAFGTLNTERSRVNSNGYSLFKGNASSYYNSTGGYHQFQQNTNSYVTIFNNAHSTPYGIFIKYDTTPNNTGSSFIECEDNSAGRFRVVSNGGVYNFSGNNSNLCDEREKKNIVALDTKWDKVKSWDLKKFHYNDDADTDDLRYGVIAQQVETVCPEVLSEWEKQKAEDAVLDDDGNVVTSAKEQILRKGVKEQQMMWMAIKALQEAQTRIETLEQRLSDAGIA